VRTFDNFQVIDPRVKTARPITIVDIDEKSLADRRLGQWPWTRRRIADMIADLTRLGGVAIAFDAVFSEPDRLNPDIAADTFSDLSTIAFARLHLSLLSTTAIYLTLTFASFAREQAQRRQIRSAFGQ
jgi:adenylate cyclase